MKFCPTCQTRYDEEILRFCTKDGTPLIEENQPAFTALPSESGEDDFGEETVIRRNPPAAAESGADQIQPTAAHPRIVIPTVEEKKPLPPVRTKTVTEYQVPPRKTNTAKIVFLTLLGVIGVLGAAVLLMMMNRSNDTGNAVQDNNVNTNFNSTDTNLNTNLNIGNSSVNFNGGINENNALNTNINTNTKANIKTPTPTPTATPITTPPPILNSNTNINVGNTNTAPTPTPAAPKPTVTPPPPPPTARPTPSDTPDARPVNVGVLNGRAVNLPKPAYPPIARQMRASGQVAVQISIDESGNVTSAKATSGNALLRASAEAAARQSKINPVKIGDRNVQAVGILIYNFINQ